MRDDNRKRGLLGALLALGAMGAATAALAQSATITDEAELREMRAAEQSTVTLGKVVTQAEMRTSERAIDAGVEDADGGPVFVVETMSEGGGSVQMLRYGLDGAFVSVAPGDAEAAVEGMAFGATGLRLSDAIATAAAETGGPVLEAGYLTEGGRVVVEAETVHGDSLTEVVIDAETGAILEVRAGADAQGEAAEADEAGERGGTDG